MKSSQVSLQIGKRGLTHGTIEAIKNAFKTRENVKVCVLKSAGHEKKKIKQIAEEIQKELGERYTYRIIGFTIFLKKWRKARNFK